jgi:Sugar phosphate permease
LEQTISASKHSTLAPARWTRIIPLSFVTYSLAYLDRANYGFGAAGGMAKTLGLNANTSALISALFFLGYFVFQIPGARYAEARSARNLVFWSLIAWGIFASLTGVITNLVLLAIDRLLLGVAESVVMPSMLVFLMHWFTKKERSRANTLLILGNPLTILWMSVFSGYLVQTFGWQNMFIIEGIPCIIWAFVWRKLAADNPKDAKWLSPEDLQDVEQALQSDQQALKQTSKQTANIWAAFRSPTVLLLATQMFFLSVGAYGLVLWLPSIIKEGSNLGLGITGVLSALPYLLAIISMMTISYFSDRTLKRKIFIWPFFFASAIAFYLSYALGHTNFWISYVCIVLAVGLLNAPNGPFWAIAPDVMPRESAGVSMALMNAMGGLGSFVGAYLIGFLNSATGGSGLSFIVLACSVALAGICNLPVKMPPTSHPDATANSEQPELELITKGNV